MDERQFIKEVAPAVQANTPRPRRGAGLPEAVPNPSVTPGSDAMGGIHREKPWEPATGDTISIVAARG